MEGVAVNAFTSLSDDNEISPRLSSVGPDKRTDAQEGQAFTLHNKPDYETVSTTLTIDCSPHSTLGPGIKFNQEQGTRDKGNMQKGIATANGMEEYLANLIRQSASK